MHDMTRLAHEYRQLRRNGESDQDAAEIVDAEMAEMIAGYVKKGRVRYERRTHTQQTATTSHTEGEQRDG